MRKFTEKENATRNLCIATVCNYIIRNIIHNNNAQMSIDNSIGNKLSVKKKQTSRKK